MFRPIVVFILVALSLTGCGSPAASFSNHTLTLNVTGYIQSCAFQPYFYVEENGSWRKAKGEESLVERGPYYLDGKYTGYTWCDEVVCNPIETPYQVELAEYRQVGEEAAPDDPAKKVADFQTVPLQGKVKVEFTYFMDETCQDKKIFSTILNL
jgi:hypothetical protein